MNAKEQTQYIHPVKPTDLESMASGLKERESVKESARKAQRLRDGLPNQLRLATLAMIDNEFHRQILAIRYSSAPWRKLYATWNSSLRCPNASVHHHLGFVDGTNAFWGTLRESLCTFARQDDLEKIGGQALPRGYIRNVSRNRFGDVLGRARQGPNDRSSVPQPGEGVPQRLRRAVRWLPWQVGRALDL